MAEGATHHYRKIRNTQPRRIPHVTKNYYEKINQADEKTLQVWGEKILDAKAIKDVFEE